MYRKLFKLFRNGANCWLLASLFFICAIPAFAVTPDDIPLEVLATYPHDEDSFCQGLLLYEGEFYESAGLYGESSLRRVSVETGAVQQRIDIVDEYYAEGLARVGDRLIQLTWQENVAFVYDIETFAQLDTFNYTGDGWGLCYDGSELVMSNGSSQLTFRDADTFEVLRTVDVTNDGMRVDKLNELECVGDVVYANVWQTNRIVRIDKGSGDITGIIDASNLSEQQPGSANVLNCIAYNPESDTFYITGKLWPNLYEIMLNSSDTDTDNDQIPDKEDICAMTPAGEIVSLSKKSNGCSLSQLCPCEGKWRKEKPWKKHKQYVNCVKKQSKRLVKKGLMSEVEQEAILAEAAESTCGEQ